MSTRTSRKRTTTQRLGYEDTAVNVKAEPNGNDGDEEEERGSRSSRQRTRPSRGGSHLPATSSTSSAPAQVQRADEVMDGAPSHNNPFLPLHRVNKPGSDNALTQGDMKIANIALQARQQGKWDRLSDTQQTQIIKAVTRVLLLKGSTNDKISPTHVKDALARINTAYQQHSQAALREAQRLLKETFGFNVETIKTDKDSISNIFVVNDMKSPALQEILSQQKFSLNDPLRAGYRAFCHLVFVSIWTAPGRVIDNQQLLKDLRQVEPRFSESINDGQGEAGGRRQVAVRTGSGIDELSGMGFSSLVQRMVKEGYLKETKDMSDPANMAKRQFTLGPRFFVEVGLKQLARSYFIATGVPQDTSVLHELDRERKGYISGNVDEEDDEEDEDEEDEEEDGGHEEQKGGRR